MAQQRLQRLLLAVAALCLTGAAQAFYLPGVAPQDFKKKDVIVLKVNKLSSVRNQLPYEYYSLPYCRPERIVPSAENLGEVLRGDRIENSLYQASAGGWGDAQLRPIRHATHACSRPGGALLRLWGCTSCLAMRRSKCGSTSSARSSAASSRSTRTRPRRSSPKSRTTTASTCERSPQGPALCSSCLERRSCRGAPAQTAAPRPRDDALAGSWTTCPSPW